jgi:hypothetical protein
MLSSFLVRRRDLLLVHSLSDAAYSGATNPTKPHKKLSVDITVTAAGFVADLGAPAESMNEDAADTVVRVMKVSLEELIVQACKHSIAHC